MRFYLGAHMPSWLPRPDAVPMFVSHRRLERLRQLPKAATAWCLDSGGFTELVKHGRWTVTPDEYADAVERYATDIGRLEWPHHKTGCASRPCWLEPV